MERLTRKEAEKLCRDIIAPELGKMEIPKDLFKESVDQLLAEFNGKLDKDVH